MPQIIKPEITRAAKDDPTRNIASPQLESRMHQPRPEQYIWRREDAISEKPNINGSWTSEGNTHLEPGGWEAADSLGGTESSMEFYQWNGDGGMYAWPGYDGISPFLAHFKIAPVVLLLDGIYYPVKYQGFFRSSDEKLNRMWMVGAYTAHLCMQDDIWDAPKRDRGRWMGDLDVSGRTIEDAFDDHFLMEETLDRLIGEPPVMHHVDGIAGYSAFWITGETEYYRHTGSRKQLESVHERLAQLMRYMETELDNRKLYANNSKSFPFVDWSPELEADTPELRRATQFEYYDGFRDGIYLLRELGDTQNADAFQKCADELKAAAQKYLLDLSGSFGARWQTNAYAVLSDVADPTQYEAIWDNSLSTVGHIKYNALIITPYYNYYVISAMAKMGHRAEALDWIRQYWGGMIDEGATSFWEGYDPSWYKQDFHAALQADDSTGYQASLAHGWSSGVTPWLMEQVLGIQPRGPGFSEVDIRPDLLDLNWAQGGEPTLRGMLKVETRKENGLKTIVDLPPGTIAHISLPVSVAGAPITVNGENQNGETAEHGSRAIIVLKTAGHFELLSH